MKTNCELPLCLMDKNLELNEYDFVLYHLYSTNERYKNYYQSVRFNNPDRIMILDNSAYEYFVKGESLDIESFINCILELNPTYYILPDVLMDKEKTLNNTVKFMVNMLGKGSTQSQPLAVAQGVTEEEMVDCLLQFEEWGIKNVAIPFHNSFFKSLSIYTAEDIKNDFLSEYGRITEDIYYALGRIAFVDRYRDLLKRFDYVHMLGSHCPLEKVYYKDFDSMDTGYPVKCGYVGDELFKEACKPNVIIDEFLNEELDIETKTRIEDNVNLFKNL